MNPMITFPDQAGGYVLAGDRWFYARMINGSLTRLTGSTIFPDRVKGWLPRREWAEQIGGEKAPWIYGWEPCPYCAAKCECDTVDVGVGVTQCGPYYCQECGASEIGPHDQERALTDQEKASGWYQPGAEPGSSANVVDGQIVSHEVARDVYRALYPLSATDKGRKMIRDGSIKS